ncbi:MAG TPA: chloride channel protein [Patescibacteria group bacterium]|nr:chloride channel protein [Patescibacteria group bacterium]
MADPSSSATLGKLKSIAPQKGQFGMALEPQVVKICGYALLMGLIGGLVAQGLLELIYFFTNVFFYGKASFRISYPDHTHVGIWIILIPVMGGLVAGLLIQFAEPTLKGHGIPEAMEAVLFAHSRMRVRVAILKPLATALVIGTGGPFGAEGPIIQTGAAIGSLLGKAVKLPPYYRRVLLAAGAAAGMAATFTAPLAGILLAVELLLFELKARSFIPVALASAVATGVRIHFVGWAPMFPTPAFKLTGMNELWLFGVLGLLMGVVGIAMIRTMSWLEDFFDHLPIKGALVWSPVIGAFILGIIAYFYPQVLGTSYDTIREMLNDRLTVGALLSTSISKFWALLISLGSGTTGGVFAPTLVVGGGIGAAFAVGCRHIFPHLVSDPSFYALAAMAGLFGGIARAPFTSIVFLFELSHNPNSLLPLIVCVMIADGFVRLFSRDSMMTVKLVKRGLIVLQDFSVPVLMRMRIDQAMHKEFDVVGADDDLETALKKFSTASFGVMPVVDKDGTLVGILEAEDLLKTEPPDHHFKMRELARQDYVIAYPNETVDQVNRDMLLKNVEDVVVVQPSGPRKPIGLARANDILQLRRWLMEEQGQLLGAPAATKTIHTS